ncbi:5325_t:CDS:10 [Paraglomus occultum]|uniref:5325_t:CDS:1 n=1 Tax=Paraglomus occultum TaxID=144539 RepID=A0A9N9A2M9_9GLOM|nr:5325_t:CDS:10 [Paraglomus occultum]
MSNKLAESPPSRSSGRSKIKRTTSPVISSPPKRSLDSPSTPKPRRLKSDLGVSTSIQKTPQKPESVWDIIDAVSLASSPTNGSPSPRRQNLIARMTGPSLPKLNEGVSRSNSWHPSITSPTKSPPRRRLSAGIHSDYTSLIEAELAKIDTSPCPLITSSSTTTMRREQSLYEDVTDPDSLMSPENDISNPLDTSPSPSRRGVRYTYGKSRTIATHDDSPKADASKKERSIFDVGENDTVPKKKDVRSRQELREAGENKLFNDEMEYITEGLGKRQPLNVQRISAITLARKLLKPKFIQRAKSHNWIPRIYDAFRCHQDSCCFAFVICFLVKEVQFVDYLIGKPDFLKLLVGFLDITSDPLITTDAAIKRSEKSLFLEIKELVGQMDEVTEKTQISLKFLSLNVMSILVSAKTRYEDTIKTRLRITGGLTAVVRLLKAELSLPSSIFCQVYRKANTKRFSRQLSLSNPDATLNLERIEQCLKILEKLTSFCPENQLHIVKNEEELFPLMLEFLLYCQVEACNRDSYEASLAMECLLGSLRVLINLTNDNQACCCYVGRPPGMSVLIRLAIVGQIPSSSPSLPSPSSPIEKGPEMLKKKNVEQDAKETVEAVKFDVLLLSLGLLINLVEMDAGNQDALREIEQSSSCPGSYACLRGCTCSSRESAVSCLVDLYNYQLERETNQTDDNIVAAYMAVLLGLLIKDNKSNQDVILSRLPNHSVSSLIALIQEFAQFNEVIGEEASANGHVASGQMLMSAGELALKTNDLQISADKQNQRGRSIGDSFLEIVDMLKQLEIEQTVQLGYR